MCPCRRQPATGTLQKRHAIVGAFALLAIIAVALPWFWPTGTGKEALTYTQITNFTDSAVSPALSPDGRMLAFIRSDNWWLTPDQIYVKLLPDGEPVQLTHDSRPKYGLAFSPDGSRIVYTVAPVVNIRGVATRRRTDAASDQFLRRHVVGPSSHSVL